MLLGFPLSLLFFIDQNISESMVNSPDNKLLKGIQTYGTEAFIGWYVKTLGNQLLNAVAIMQSTFWPKNGGIERLD